MRLGSFGGCGEATLVVGGGGGGGGGVFSANASGPAEVPKTL
jgi:hypothetical protein